MFHYRPIVLIITTLSSVYCYPSGLTVDDACLSLAPSHGVTGRTDSAPYLATFTPLTFSPGQTVSVTLQATGAKGFMGFMIQARRADTSQNQEMLGSFNVISQTRQACTGKSLVHSNSFVKNKLTFDWISPATTVGNVVFRVTYVQEKTIFWSNTVSSTLVETIATTSSSNISTTSATTSTTTSTVPATTTTNTGTTTSSTTGFAASDATRTTFSTNSNLSSLISPLYSTSTTTTTVAVLTAGPTSLTIINNDISSTSSSTQSSTQNVVNPLDPECGSTKGCFSSCNTDGCNFLVSWQVKDTSVVYTLTAARAVSSGVYIALGFSSDSKMGDDSVMGCVYQNNTFAKYTGFNVVNSPREFSDNEIQLTGSSYVNGVLTCQITRPLDGSGQRYNLSLPWTLLFVSGQGVVNEGQAFINNHYDDKHVSEAQVSALSYMLLSSEDSNDRALVKAHGCLMVGAWIFLASIGTVLARFYKPVLSNTWFSKQIWFQLHRCCMVLVLFTTSAAFIIIFVKEKEWSDIEEEEKFLEGHPIMGVIVMILTILNPVMALFRPHPGTPKRPIFNWAHLLVGMSAHMLGIVTIFFGVKLTAADTPGYTVKILGAYVAWQIFIYILLEIVTRCTCLKKSKKEMYELNDVDSLKSHPSGISRESAIKMVILALHCFVVAALTAVIIALIAVGGSGAEGS